MMLLLMTKAVRRGWQHLLPRRKELKEVIDVLQQAIAILGETGGGTLITTTSNLEQFLTAMVWTFAFSTADANKLPSAAKPSCQKSKAEANETMISMVPSARQRDSWMHD